MPIFQFAAGYLGELARQKREEASRKLASQEAFAQLLSKEALAGNPAIFQDPATLKSSGFDPEQIQMWGNIASGRRAEIEGNRARFLDQSGTYGFAMPGVEQQGPSQPAPSAPTAMPGLPSTPGSPTPMVQTASGDTPYWLVRPGMELGTKNLQQVREQADEAGTQAAPQGKPQPDVVGGFTEGFNQARRQQRGKYDTSSEEAAVSQILQEVSQGGPPGTSATMSMREGGETTSLTRAAPSAETRAQMALSKVQAAKLPLSVLNNVLAQGNLPMPQGYEQYANTFTTREILNRTKTIQGTEGVDLRTAQRQAARAVADEYGYVPEKARDLVFASQAEADEGFRGFALKGIAAGRYKSLSEAENAAERSGFTIAPSARKELAETAFHTYFSGALQKYAGQGTDAAAAAQKAAQEAAAFTGQRGISDKFNKIVFPEKPPLNQDVEAELRIKGQTGQTASGSAIESAQRDARAKSLEDAQKKLAMERGVTPGAPAERPTAGERKELSQVDAKVSILDRLLGQMADPKAGISDVLGPALTRPGAAAARTGGQYVSQDDFLARMGVPTLNDKQRAFLGELAGFTSALKTALIGAARTKPELQDLVPLIPEPSDLPESVAAKLRALRVQLLANRISIEDVLRGSTVQAPGAGSASTPKPGRLIRNPDGTETYVP